MNQNGVTNPKKLRDADNGGGRWHRPVADRKQYEENLAGIDWSKKRAGEKK